MFRSAGDQHIYNDIALNIATCFGLQVTNISIHNDIALNIATCFGPQVTNRYL
jgi:hypothetical protein